MKTIVMDRELRAEVPEHLSSVISIIPADFRKPAPVSIQVCEQVQETSHPRVRVLSGRERFVKLVAELGKMGVIPERVDLAGWKTPQGSTIKFKAVTLTADKLSSLPKGAQLAYQRVMGLEDCRPDSWTVLEEIPPPVMRPSYRLDPWLAFRVGDKYYGVFHWD